MPDEPNTNEEVEEVVSHESHQPETNEEVVGSEEEQQQPHSETPEGPEEEPEEQPEEAPEQPPSRREQLRIQQLLQKYGDPRRQQAQQQTPSQRRDALDYEQALDADPETIKQLQEDRQREGQVQYNEGLKRAEFLDWRTSLKIDSPNVEKKYPILDKTSPEFHPAVADAVNRWYLNMSGFDPQQGSVNNPNISYADFVESYMELVQETAGQRNAQTVKNVARQAAATGLRPDGSSANRLNLNKDPSDMTIEELYASMGQKPPKK